MSHAKVAIGAVTGVVIEDARRIVQRDYRSYRVYRSPFVSARELVNDYARAAADRLVKGESTELFEACYVLAVEVKRRVYDRCDMEGRASSEFWFTGRHRR